MTSLFKQLRFGNIDVQHFSDIVASYKNIDDFYYAYEKESGPVWATAIAGKKWDIARWLFDHQINSMRFQKAENELHYLANYLDNNEAISLAYYYLKGGVDLGHVDSKYGNTTLLSLLINCGKHRDNKNIRSFISACMSCASKDTINKKNKYGYSAQIIYNEDWHDFHTVQNEQEENLPDHGEAFISGQTADRTNEEIYPHIDLELWKKYVHKSDFGPEMTIMIKKLHLKKYRMRYFDVCKKIWKDLVPAMGQADTVQGELLRQTEKLRTEAMDNGNINWDDNFEWFCYFIGETLFSFDGLDEKEKHNIGFILEYLRQCGNYARHFRDGDIPRGAVDIQLIAYVENDLYDYLSDAIAKYSLGQLTLIPYKHKEFIFR